MRVYIGNDHGGVEVKYRIMELLQTMDIPCVNVGTDTGDIVRYPYYAADVCRAVAAGTADRGILLCSTGIGMSIVANKFPGIRAALCHSTYDARMTRAHNNSNVLCLGGRTVGLFEILDMVETWIKTDYIGGRHDISLGLIEDAERTNLTGSLWDPPLEGRR